MIYAFGGPDILFPFTIYPNIKELILTGLESPGPLVSKENLDSCSEVFTNAMDSSYAKKGGITSMTNVDKPFYGDFDFSSTSGYTTKIICAFATLLRYRALSVETERDEIGNEDHCPGVLINLRGWSQREGITCKHEYFRKR